MNANWNIMLIVGICLLLASLIIYVFKKIRYKKLLKKANNLQKAIKYLIFKYK